LPKHELSPGPLIGIRVSLAQRRQTNASNREKPGSRSTAPQCDHRAVVTSSVSFTAFRISRQNLQGSVSGYGAAFIAEDFRPVSEISSGQTARAAGIAEFLVRDYRSDFFRYRTRTRL
jgi:hypothetical protein